MSDPFDKDEQGSDQVLLDSVRSRLQQSETAIDEATLARLYQARRVALDALAKTDRPYTQETVIALPDWQRWLMPASSVAATVAIAALVFNLAVITPEMAPPVEGETLSVMDDMAILGAPDEIDLYQDLEFYEWLSVNKDLG